MKLDYFRFHGETENFHFSVSPKRVKVIKGYQWPNLHIQELLDLTAKIGKEQDFQKKSSISNGYCTIYFFFIQFKKLKTCIFNN